MKKAPDLPEVTSVRARIEHVRAAGVPIRVARMMFVDNKLDWTAFLANGINVDELEAKASGNPFARYIAREARTDVMPVVLPGGEIRVYHRHIRAAKICMSGSREFFVKHELNWNDFLEHGIAVSKLEEIGDPIALRAAHKAVEEERHGRR